MSSGGSKCKLKFPAEMSARNFGFGNPGQVCLKVTCGNGERGFLRMIQKAMPTFRVKRRRRQSSWGRGVGGRQK